MFAYLTPDIIEQRHRRIVAREACAVCRVLSVLAPTRLVSRSPPGYSAAALVHFLKEGEMTPDPDLLFDDGLAADGGRASGRQHPVQHRHADGSLGLLGGEATGTQTRSD